MSRADHPERFRFYLHCFVHGRNWGAGEITTDLGTIVSALRSATKVPLAVGFGIHTPAQAAKVAETADGVIVGSAIVKIIADTGKTPGRRFTGM